MISSLLRPEAFPHSPESVELIQTQISFVLLAGEFAYKIKKPVDFGFLDFSTLEKRFHYCSEEVRLNRRLSPELYLGVVPITRRGGDFFLEGEGEPVEFAVKMRRLPQHRMLDVLLQEEKASPEMLEEVASVVSRFHEKAFCSPEILRFGEISVIRGNIEENFAQTEEYKGVTISEEDYDLLKEYSFDFLKRNVPLFERRIKERRIRDCHGDLHAAHICFADKIYIFDCIEFNDRFRYSDVACEIAFLSMDLDFWGYPAYSEAFVRAYVRETRDEDLLELLDFYKCYRAYVRGKVEGFKLKDPAIPAEEKERALRRARRYFDLASFYVRPRRPLLLVLCGLIGTGKTTVAEALGRRLGAPVISSDRVRKELAGIPPTEPRFEEFGKGIYSPDFSKRTYEKMFEEAERCLREGRTAILDASFRKREERLRARELARRAGAGFLAVECRCPEEEILRRLEERRRGVAVSDGRPELLPDIKRDFEEIAELHPSEHLVVDTRREVGDIAFEIWGEIIRGRGERR